MDMIDKLDALISEAGLCVTFDRRADQRRPCWGCDVSADQLHDLVVIGTYSNGDPIRRPLCEGCKEILKPTTMTKAAKCKWCEREPSVVLVEKSQHRATWWYQVQCPNSTCACHGPRHESREAAICDWNKHHRKTTDGEHDADS